MKFVYCMKLKEGYKPTCEEEPQKEVEIIIEAKNRVTSDRMFRAIMKDCTNIEEGETISTCIEH